MTPYLEIARCRRVPLASTAAHLMFPASARLRTIAMMVRAVAIDPSGTSCGFRIGLVSLSVHVLVCLVMHVIRVTATCGRRRPELLVRTCECIRNYLQCFLGDKILVHLYARIRMLARLPLATRSYTYVIY